MAETSPLFAITIPAMITSGSPESNSAHADRRRSFARTARALGSLAGALFPPRCLVCAQPLSAQAESLCETCHAQIDSLTQQRACPTCAADVGAHAASDGRCRQCRTESRAVTGTVRASHYRSIVGQLLRSFKYNAREELEPLLAALLQNAIARASWREQVEAIVPVPTHWRRRLLRNIYTADVLAAAAASRLRLPVARVLRRIRSGPHQVGLSYTKRAENVRGAFAMCRGLTLRAPTILLIDDVRTTGATLNECARVLREAGAARVYAAVVARVGFEDRRDVKNLTI